MSKSRVLPILPTRDYGILQKGVAQALVAGAVTTVTFDQIIYLNGYGFNGAQFGIQVIEDNIYMCSFHCHFTSNVTGSRIIGFNINGVNTFWENHLPATLAGLPTSLGITMPIRLAAGDTISAFVWTNAAGISVLSNPNLPRLHVYTVTDVIQ